MPRATFLCLLYLPATVFLHSTSACGGRASEAQLASGEASAPATPESLRLADQALPIEYTQQTPAFRNSQALQYLPKTTLALMISESPLQLAKALESTSILKEYPDVFSDIEKLSVPKGAMLFLPETWDKAGIDANGSAGTALEMRDQQFTMYFFTSVKDKKQIGVTLRSIGGIDGQTISPIGDDADEYIVTWPKAPETAVVVRNEVVFLLVAGTKDVLAESLRRMTALSAEQSMATVVSGDRFKGFDFGEKLAGFVSFQEIAKSYVADASSGQHAIDNLERLEQKYSLAIYEGRDKEAASLKEEIAQQLKWHRRDQLREAADLMVIQRYLAPLASAPLGLHSDGGSTRLRMQLRPKAESAIASLFTANTAPLTLPMRMQGRPIVMVGGHFRGPKLLALIEPLLFSVGVTPNTLRSTVKDYLGITFQEFSSHFDGEISAGFSVDLSPTSTLMASLGVHFLAHLRNPKETQALLTRASKKDNLKKYAKIVDGITILDVPSFFEKGKIRIRIKGEFLEARTLREFNSKPDWNAEERALFTASASRGIFVMDPSLFMLTFAIGFTYASTAIAGERTLSKSEVKRLAKLRETEKSLRREIELAFLQQAGQSSKKFGRLIVTAQNRNNGYALLAGLFGSSPNLGRGIQALVELAEPELELTRTEKPAKVKLLRERLNATQEEIWKIRP